MNELNDRPIFNQAANWGELAIKFIDRISPTPAIATSEFFVGLLALAVNEVPLPAKVVGLIGIAHGLTVFGGKNNLQ